MSDWIGKTYRSTVGWDHAERLVDVGPRMGGSEDERRAVDLTQDALEDVGVGDVRLEPFDIQGWTRGESRVTTDTESYDCIGLPYSPPGRVTGELVDLRHGLPSDFEAHDVEGNVVMSSSHTPPTHRPVHRLEKYMNAVERGAVAFVFRNHVKGCFPRSGTVGGHDGAIGDVPAVGISNEEGSRLARRRAGDEVVVEVNATLHDATSHNVHGELGPDSEQRVVIGAHVDSHDVSEGAGDDAVGVGMVVELARILADREDELGARVQCSVFGAEELGFLGSAHHVRSIDPESVKAMVQHDGVVRERNLQLFTNGFDGLGEIGRRIANRYPDPISLTDELALASDHWRYVERGIPAILAASEPSGGGSAFGSSSGYVTSPADTFDKLDPRDFREQIVPLADLIVELTDPEVGFEHRTTDDIEAQLEREEKARLATGFNEWFDPVR